MLNPLMLLGLAALGIPVLIHLINRRRMKPRQFATLDFLDQQDVANAFAPVPRDLLQLLLRLPLLTLFILLMVRMTGSSPTVGPRAMAIVLDNSMSMKRLTPDGRRLVDVHRERILDLIERSGSGAGNNRDASIRRNFWRRACSRRLRHLLLPDRSWLCTMHISSDSRRFLYLV